MAWGVLFLGLMLTLAIWLTASRMVREGMEDRFRFRQAEIVQAIGNRIQAYEQVLHGARGLLRASSDVNRAEWRVFVKSQQLDTRYPGILGVGFARWTAAEDVAALEQQVRAEGLEGFRVWPEGPRDTFTPIIYLEPFDKRNRRALGYDMWSEPVRNAAMSLARDTGRAAVTGRVRLVQETDSDAQNGFLMYLPYYGSPWPAENVQVRRRRIRGFVYAPFRMGDFMAPLEKDLLDGVALHIHTTSPDGEEVPDGLLYASPEADGEEPVAAGGGRDTLMRGTANLQLPGALWVLEFEALPTFAEDSDLWIPPVILALAATFSLLGAATAYSAAVLRREQARAAALGRIVEESATEVYVLDARNLRLVQATRGARRNLGYPAETLREMSLTDIQPQMSADQWHELTRPLRDGQIDHTEYETLQRRADGTDYEAQVSLQMHKTAVPPLFHAVVQDVTARKQQEQVLTRALADAQSLLAEKETLLREVHHRVKNNLQVIWSLIRLEASDIADPEVRDRLDIVARRIGVLGQIHQQLYGSDNLARVDMGEHMRQLGGSLAELHAHQDIRISVRSADVLCDLEVAIPLGLIANELISNSLEHAFPAGSPGRVDVVVEQREGRVVLEVSDNGVGDPDEADPSRKDQPRGGLGLRLIDALAGQLGAELSVSHEGGTRTTLVLPAAAATVT